MSNTHWATQLRPLAAALLATAALVFTGTPASAREPVENFLDNLRRLDMHDVAVLYLESLYNKPNLDPKLREILPYEEGVSLIAGSRSNRDITLRMKQLDDAAAKFQDFVKKNPKHSLVAMANTQLGNVLVERAKVEFEKSKRPVNVDKKDELLKEARRLFDEAKKVFENAEKQFEEDLKKYPNQLVQEENPELYAQRDITRRDYMQARLFAASVIYEAAQAYDEKDPKRKALLMESADKYQKINERWRDKLAGLYALMWAGRSLLEAGELKRALGLYGELMLLPISDTDPTTGALRAQTLRLAIAAWIDPAEKKFDEAIKQGEDWIGRARGVADRTTDGLGVHWMVAQAQMAKADTIKGDKPTDKTAKNTLLASALRHAKMVAGTQNEFRKPAQELVAKLSGVEGDGGPPATFAAAREKGQEAIENSQVFKNQADKATDANEKKKLLAQQLEAERKAFDLFNLSLQLAQSAEEPVSVDDINRVRYLLCFLHYRMQNFYEAAIIGEYLGDRFPGFSSARAASRIALACYEQTSYLDPKTRDVDVRQMTRVANLIVDRWPKEPEADIALMTLGKIHLDAANTDPTRLDEAISTLAKISEESASRPLADVRAGQAIWKVFIRESKNADGKVTPEIAKKKTDAAALLLKGINSMRKNVTPEAPPQYELLTAEISLIQLLIEDNKPEEALKILERKPLGLLERVQANDPTTKYGNLEPETYKAALRAYVSVNRGEDAEKMMNALEKTYAKPEDADKLTRIYVRLGKEIETQLQDIKNSEAADKVSQEEKLLENFERFLSRITARDNNNFATLYWIAETFYSLGAGTEARGKMTETSKKYFGLASTAYNKILSEMGSQAGFVAADKKEQLALRFQVKLANCARRKGDFQVAVNALKKILEANNMMLEAQIELAYTYQAWGESDVTKFNAAILGDGSSRIDPKTKRKSPLFWGWAYQAKLLQKQVGKSVTFTAYFHEARYNLALCHYKQALASASPTDKKAKLERAEQDILIIARLYPDLGQGAGEWDADLYRKLFIQILRSNSKQGDLDSVIAANREAARKQAEAAGIIGAAKK